MDKIFFPGSFNPFTAGHADILNRLLSLSDTVVIGIGMNIDKPESKDSAEKNAEEVRNYVRNRNLEGKVEVAVYDGLSGEEALKRGASCMARGVRTSADFEFEFSLASANRDAFGIETILLPADPKLSFVSSTMIRDLMKHDRQDLANKYLPN